MAKRKFEDVELYFAKKRRSCIYPFTAYEIHRLIHDYMDVDREKEIYLLCIQDYNVTCREKIEYIVKTSKLINSEYEQLMAIVCSYGGFELFKYVYGLREISNPRFSFDSYHLSIIWNTGDFKKIYFAIRTLAIDLTMTVILTKYLMWAERDKSKEILSNDQLVEMIEANLFIKDFIINCNAIVSLRSLGQEKIVYPEWLSLRFRMKTMCIKYTII